MGAASVVLGIVSMLMMFAGIVLTVIPGLGMVLSFGAPVLALAGAVLGGLAMSRARQEGESSGGALAGLILNVIAFLFGLIFALTCGLCNALCTASMATQPPHRDDAGVWHFGDPNIRWRPVPGLFDDAGPVVQPPASSPPSSPGFEPPSDPAAAPAADEPPVSGLRGAPAPDTPRRGALPPPPLPPGPPRPERVQSSSELPVDS
jgi:hypothetical protein